MFWYRPSEFGLAIPTVLVNGAQLARPWAPCLYLRRSHWATSVGPDYIVIAWPDPLNNGSAITSYSLDMKKVCWKFLNANHVFKFYPTKLICAYDTSKEGTPDFIHSYQGAVNTFVATLLHPDTSYFVRYCASNGSVL